MEALAAAGAREVEAKAVREVEAKAAKDVEALAAAAAREAEVSSAAAAAAAESKAAAAGGGESWLRIKVGLGASAALAALAGDYRPEGTTNGAPRYRLSGRPAGGDRFLYRSLSGRWSVTTSEAKVAQNKGFVSSEAGGGGGPVGLRYRTFAGGIWSDVPVFEVTHLAPWPAARDGTGDSAWGGGTRDDAGRGASPMDDL